LNVVHPVPAGMREGKKGPYRSSARWHAVRAEPISEDNASPKIDKVRIRRPYRPRTACGHVVVGGCRPVHAPSLIWGLLLCVLLAAIVLVRILDRALHGPLRPGDLQNARKFVLNPGRECFRTA